METLKIERGTENWANYVPSLFQTYITVVLIAILFGNLSRYVGLVISVHCVLFDTAINWKLLHKLTSENK